MKKTIRNLSIIAVIGLAGCDESEVESWVDEASEEEPSFRSVVYNATVLNGTLLNGTLLNTNVLLGNASGTDSVTLRGFNHPVYASQGSLAMVASGGSLVYNNPSANVAGHTGAQLVGLTLNYDVKRSGVVQAVDVKIAGHAKELDALMQYYSVYDLQMRTSGGTWQSLCQDGAGNPVKAIILDAHWDPATGGRGPSSESTATFACQGAALAKCVKLGYVPWTVGGLDFLFIYHQACTRMLRADYCGDGTVHTVPGTPIHVYDHLNFQKQSTANYVVEAEWGPQGAVCLNPENTRLPNQTIGCSIPTCYPQLFSSGIIQSGKLLP